MNFRITTSLMIYSIVGIYYMIAFNVESQKINNDELVYLVMSSAINTKTHYYEISEPDISDTSFLSLLLLVESDSLFIVDTLNFNPKENNSMRNIIHRMSDDFFLFMEMDMFDYYSSFGDLEKELKKKKYLSILDYSENPFILRKIDSDSLEPFEDANFLTSASYNIEGQNYWPYTYKEGFYLMTKEMDHILKLSDVHRMSNYIVENSPGYSLIITYTYVFHPTKGFILKRDSSSPWQEWTRFTDFDYPVEKEDGIKYKSFKIYYHTATSKYMIGKKSDEFNKYFIRNNMTFLWDTIRLPSVVFNVYADEFIYGTVDLRSFDKKIDEEKLMKRYSRVYANYPYLSTLSGTFFIYHVPSRKCIYYEGEDIDTELLAIRNGWVYFREFDTIKKIKLNEEAITFDMKSIKIIAQDVDMVPNIHHIFFAPKATVLKEYVSPK